MKTTIRSLGSSGEGVGQTEEGKTLFIEGALPQESVSYSIEAEKKSYAKGRLLQILEPSSSRVHPPCPVFGECGGCQIQHLAYEAQLEAKRQRVMDALNRIGKIEAPVHACLSSPMPLHYRNKIQLPTENGIMGLYKRNSHDIVPVKNCLIQCASGEAIYRLLQKERLPAQVTHLLIRNAIFTDEALVVFIINKEVDLIPLAQKLLRELPQVKGVLINLNKHKGNRILGPQFKLLAGRPTIREKLGSLLFDLSAPSFFQVNSWQAINLFEYVSQFIDIKEHVIDAFCGVGTLALFAAQKAARVEGYECVEQAVIDARANAALNGFTNCHFEVGFAEKRALKCDTLLLNPPRKGLSPEIFSKIQAKKIVYISCDPATLARDLALFQGFKLQSIQPFDMFPQTMHVESAAYLTK